MSAAVDLVKGWHYVDDTPGPRQKVFGIDLHIAAYSNAMLRRPWARELKTKDGEHNSPNVLILSAPLFVHVTISHRFSYLLKSSNPISIPYHLFSPPSPLSFPVCLNAAILCHS